MNTKEPNHDSQIGYGHQCLSEGNITYYQLH